MKPRGIKAGAGEAMRRREFFTLLGGVAAAWPLAASTQLSDQMRRIGVLMNKVASDSQGHARVAAFKQSLEQLGWTDGGNVRIDVCWGADDVDRERQCATDLAALAPNIVFASGTLSVAVLKPISSNVPIVFVGVTDPVGVGFVDSLARPGGNVTGFMIYEYSLSGKWLGLLKDIAPSVTRVGIRIILSVSLYSAPSRPKRSRLGWR
jgi:ABC-type uncharacterized transport system substrate-binding protein